MAALLRTLLLAACLMAVSGDLHVQVDRSQVRPIPNAIIAKLVRAGGFGGIVVGSTAECRFLEENSNHSITLSVPNDYIEQFSTTPSAALDRWVDREVYQPLSRGYLITSITLGHRPLSAAFGGRFYDSMPAALSNLADKVRPLGIQVLVSVGVPQLSASYPPSAGEFDPAISLALTTALAAASALSLEAYPFLLTGGVSDPATLGFLAMQQGSNGFWDDGAKLWYPDVLSSLHDAADLRSSVSVLWMCPS
jgi:hypothetical protein